VLRWRSSTVGGCSPGWSRAPRPPIPAGTADGRDGDQPADALSPHPPPRQQPDQQLLEHRVLQDPTSVRWPRPSFHRATAGSGVASPARTLERARVSASREQVPRRLAAGVKPDVYSWPTCGFCPRRDVQGQQTAFASLITWSALLRSTFWWSERSLSGQVQHGSAFVLPAIRKRDIGLADPCPAPSDRRRGRSSVEPYSA
jgi:hypothetical protein